MSLNLFGPRARQDPAQAAMVKEWAAAAFALSVDATVMVTELHCTEPGCPPLETVIALMGDGAAPRQFKLHLALAEVTRADVEALARPEPADQAHKHTISAESIRVD